MFFKDDEAKIKGLVIKKLRVIKRVGVLILLLIVFIQIFRIVFFDFTAVSILKL